MVLVISSAKPTLTVKEPELLLAACPLGEVARSSLA
ncbi:hypothetical protein FHR83_005529 [Actinoplanes campanulatus]|jgi:hypothetical protein|uniref:Uncharacterized protein n=1 Tax=Actinoplanes campanulatus TaxID=113559 RepID=A0A7W5AKK5_9ACTN|nr:hypothetical protein [Actinoplanes campanulatus]